jgi:hypothetical protein
LREDFSKLIDDAANFKLDEKEVVRFGYALTTTLAETSQSWRSEIADFGDGLAGVVEWVVKGALTARDAIRDAAGWLNDINNKANLAGKFPGRAHYQPLTG